MTSTRPASRINAWVIALAALAAWLIYTLSTILMPFVLAALLAYVCHPLARRLTRPWFPPALAALLVLLILTGIGAAFGVLVLPMLYYELNQVLAKLPAVLSNVRDVSAPYLQQALGIDLRNNLDQLRDMLQQNIGNTGAALQKLLRSASEGGALVISLLITLLLVPVVLFYLLKDWDRLMVNLLEAVPSRHRLLAISLAQEVDTVLGQFLRGQLVVMAVMASIYAIGLHLIGLQSGVAIGIMTGLLVFIPYVGVFTGFVLAMLAAMIQGPGADLLLPVLAVFATGHILEGTLITPRLVGERIGLHPVMVIFALLAFGKLLGFFGVVIALPTSAVLRVALGRLDRALQDDEPV
ncbi:MAG: AI-2E family transporter [Betaproteobacteria bacterium]|nr:AI-2E family transporter [Betaproteobacteria bacterium]